MNHAFSVAASREGRRGSVSVMAILVLTLLAALVGSQMRRVLLERRQMRSELWYTQTLQLANAGLLRAAEQHRRSHAYRGETWNLPAGRIHKTNSAEMVIRVTSDQECVVTARYPANSDTPFRVTRSGRLPQ